MTTTKETTANIAFVKARQRELGCAEVYNFSTCAGYGQTSHEISAFTNAFTLSQSSPYLPYATTNSLLPASYL